MTIDFTSVHNHHEREVFHKVTQAASRNPLLEQSRELLIDAACIALNSLKPHYVRHDVDLRFYMSDPESNENDAAIDAAVASALKFVLSRAAAKLR
jgi:hypothetical protein